MKFILTILTFLLLKPIIVGQTSVVPIISDNILLGGVQNGKWLTAKQTLPLIKNEVDLFLISCKKISFAAKKASKAMIFVLIPE